MKQEQVQYIMAIFSTLFPSSGHYLSRIAFDHYLRHLVYILRGDRMRPIIYVVFVQGLRTFSDRVSLRGDRVSSRSGGIRLRGDKTQFELYLQTLCHTFEVS